MHRQKGSSKWLNGTMASWKFRQWWKTPYMYNSLLICCKEPEECWKQHPRASQLKKILRKHDPRLPYKFAPLALAQPWLLQTFLTTLHDKHENRKIYFHLATWNRSWHWKSFIATNKKKWQTFSTLSSSMVIISPPWSSFTLHIGVSSSSFTTLVFWTLPPENPALCTTHTFSASSHAFCEFTSSSDLAYIYKKRVYQEFA